MKFVLIRIDRKGGGIPLLSIRFIIFNGILIGLKFARNRKHTSLAELGLNNV